MTNDMRGIEIESLLYGRLTLREERFRGGQGAVYATNQESKLVKVYDPREVFDKAELAALQEQMERRYQTFAKLLKPQTSAKSKSEAQLALSCLPEEYLGRVKGKPSYLMNFAHGENLAGILEENGKHKYSQDGPFGVRERFCIGLALAAAIAALHTGSQIVHADIKEENFVLDKTNGQHIVYVLDVDGGGYVGPVSSKSEYYNVLPNVQPRSPYQPPEFVQTITWGGLWDMEDRPTKARQPDLWGLAVLLYRIIVDYDGPFPTRQMRSDVPGYKPYQKREWAGESSWPKQWQTQMMKATGISDNLIKLFTEVFDGDRDVIRAKQKRPRADRWRRRLQEAIDGGRQNGCAHPSGGDTVSRQDNGFHQEPTGPTYIYELVDPRGQSKAPKCKSIICGHCGRENSSDAIYCAHCMEPIGRTEPCPHCKKKIPAHAVYCPQCGKKTRF